jgi:hypothetical protein
LGVWFATGCPFFDLAPAGTRKKTVPGLVALNDSVHRAYHQADILMDSAVVMSTRKEHGWRVDWGILYPTLSPIISRIMTVKSTYGERMVGLYS